MSRIGKNPIVVPQGVTVLINGSEVNVTGPKGSLKMTMHVAMAAVLENNEISIKPLETGEKVGGIGALWGMTRALVQNLVVGVTQGYEKKLELHGVGYRAELK